MSKTRLILLKIIILLGLCGVFAVMGRFNHIAEYDEALHLDVARNIYRSGIPIRSSGEGVVYLEHPPLFRYVIALITGPLADGTLVGRLVSAAYGLLVVALTFRLSADLAGNAAGLMAGLGVAISPLFQIYAFNIQAEVMLTTLILAGLWSFNQGWHNRRVDYIGLAGVMFGLAIWVKFLAVLPIAACSLFWLISTRSADYRMQPTVEITPPAWPWSAIIGRRLAGVNFTARLVTNLSIGLALLAPFTLALALYVSYGLWLDQTMFLAGIHNWFIGPDWPWDPRTHFSLLGWLIVIAREVLSYPLAILLLATLPWRLQFYRRGSALLALELYSLLMLIYTMFVSVKEVRHVIPWIPVAAILVSVGLIQALRGVRLTAGPAWRRAVTGAVALLLLLEASPLTLFPGAQPATLRAWLDPPWASRVFDNDPHLVNVRDAGRYLGEVTPTGTIIPVVNQGTVAGYYADRNYRLLYVLSSEQVARILNQSEWLLVDNDIHPNITEADFARLQAYIAQNFTLVSQFDKGGIPALVYRRVAPLSTAKNNAKSP